MPMAFTNDEGKIIEWGDEGHVPEQLLELRKMIGQAYINIFTLAKIVGVPDLDEVERGDEPLPDLKALTEHLQAELDKINLSSER